MASNRKKENSKPSNSKRGTNDVNRRLDSLIAEEVSTFDTEETMPPDRDSSGPLATPSRRVVPTPGQRRVTVEVRQARVVGRQSSKIAIKLIIASVGILVIAALLILAYRYLL